MCHTSCIQFVKFVLKEEVTDKEVLEVGSYNVNGTVRDDILLYKPKTYVGVDISEGPCVDLVCSADKLIENFGVETFDIVISTEMLEHVEDWRAVVNNIKGVCKEGGIIVITTRSPGFPYHGYPNDYWRYTKDDMKAIFSDCEIINLESDTQAPGVFVKARKLGITQSNLNNIILTRI